GRIDCQCHRQFNHCHSPDTCSSSSAPLTLCLFTLALLTDDRTHSCLPFTHIESLYRFADHRITRSALASTLGGIVSPICLAAFKLITNSNFIGCSTGMSVGFVPFRILSTIAAIRLYGSVWSGPYDIKPPLAVKSPRG